MKAEFKPSRFWGAFEFYIRLVWVVFGTTAGAIAVYTFVENQRAQLVDRSFDIVALWEDGSSQNAAATLRAKILSAQAELGDGMRRDQIGSVIFSTMFQSGNETVLSSFDRTWYVLRRVSNCAASQQCDTGILNEFFCDYATSFWAYFADQLTRTDGWETSEFEAFIAGCAQPKDVE